MLKDKLTYIIELLGVDSRQLAMYSDFSESVISRLKTGARIPDKDSRTISKLVRGIYLCGDDRGRLDALCSELGCGEDKHDIKSVCAAMTLWLYDGREVAVSEAKPFSDEDSTIFGEKLGSLMELAEISNSRLSKAVNVDPSYISRIRAGERQIRRNNKLLKMICDVLAARLIEKDKTAELCAVTDIGDGSDLFGDKISEEELSDMLLGWLSDRDTSDNMLAVKQFIESIESFPVQKLLPDLPIENNCVFSDSYFGTEGLREAVERFLCTALRNGSPELLLYSDAGMEWLGNGFRQKWATLMTACVKNNTRIKIIHNVDRNARELLSAITDWLPLYMTGLIEPYYCTKKQGERFGCTLFLDPGTACVRSFYVKAAERNAEYSYITERERLANCYMVFDALMADSLPLLKISDTPQQLQGSSLVFNMGKIQICLGSKSVIVNKLSEPFLSFTAVHPLLCGAFRTFVNAHRRE